MAWKGKTYSEKLRDPRWQKKRLEVMSGSKFECESCGAKDKTLNVHHKVYRRGKQPWEYETEALSCLCEDCHSAVEELRQELLEEIKDSGWMLERVLGYVSAVRLLDGDATRVIASTYERCEGIADALRLTTKQVVKASMEFGDELNPDELRKLP
jgi:hypothetical protein